MNPCMKLLLLFFNISISTDVFKFSGYMYRDGSFAGDNFIKDFVNEKTRFIFFCFM